MADMTNPITPIPEDSCWGYLARESVGRLVTAAEGKPEIFPVNFVLDGESIIFRTAEGSKLDQLTSNSQVAFEVDGWDDENGWSVIVHGTAEKITDPDELQMAEHAPLRAWVPTVKRNYVRIAGDEVTGRAFWFGPEPTHA